MSYAWQWQWNRRLKISLARCEVIRLETALADTGCPIGTEKETTNPEHILPFIICWLEHLLRLVNCQAIPDLAERTACCQASYETYCACIEQIEA